MNWKATVFHVFGMLWVKNHHRLPLPKKTWEEDGDVSETDQFMMLYEREIDNDRTESLLVAGEEKIVGANADRCLVISTGFDIQPSDIRING